MQNLNWKEPGREFDAMIWMAMNDMEPDVSKCRYVDGDVRPHAGYPTGHVSPPNYSTNMGDAWEVVQFLRNQLGLVHTRLTGLESMWQFHCAERFIEGIIPEDARDYAGNARTPEHAICIAALRALLAERVS